MRYIHAKKVNHLCRWIAVEYIRRMQQMEDKNPLDIAIRLLSIGSHREMRMFGNIFIWLEAWISRVTYKSIMHPGNDFRKPTGVENVIQLALRSHLMRSNAARWFGQTPTNTLVQIFGKMFRNHMFEYSSRRSVA